MAPWPTQWNVQVHYLDGRPIADDDRLNIGLALEELKKIGQPNTYVVLNPDDPDADTNCDIRNLEQDIETYEEYEMRPEQWHRALEHLRSSTDAFVVTSYRSNVWDLFLGWYSRTW